MVTASMTAARPPLLTTEEVGCDLLIGKQVPGGLEAHPSLGSGPALETVFAATRETGHLLRTRRPPRKNPVPRSGIRDPCTGSSTGRCELPYMATEWHVAPVGDVAPLGLD